jgi:transaldolase
MAPSPLHQLEACGQSVWTDVISRQMIRSGALARSINDDGVTGVTANPTIFQKAIAGSHDYDETIRTNASQRCTPVEIYEALAIEDVGTAADLLRPVYHWTVGKDGFVSIEVSPDLAYQTEHSIDEARRLPPPRTPTTQTPCTSTH